MKAIYPEWSLRFCVAVLALAPAGLSASPQKPVIGLSLDSFQEERWQQDRDSFVATVEKLGGRAVVRSANFNDAQQARDITEMIQAGVDVIAVVPHSADALAIVIARARAAHISVISYDRLILNADISYYVGTDNAKVGELQAKYVADHLPAGRKARIIRVYGAPTDHNAHLVKDGQDRILEPLIRSGRIEVVQDGWAQDWKPDEAKRLVAAVLAQTTAIDAVVTSNDGTAGGAIEALAEKGLAGKVLVTGQDADLAACARIKDGTQSMTVYKAVDKLAGITAQLAIEVAQGKSRQVSDTIANGGFKPVPFIFIAPVIVDKDNLTAIIAERLHRPKA